MRNPDWKLWSWQHIGDGESSYLDRLHLFRTPWFGAQLHWIRRPDAQRDPHNHPRTFIRIVLRGGYGEILYRGKSQGKLRRLCRFRPEVMHLDYWHRITVVQPNTLSLCIVGPKRQEWGFWTVDGVIGWKEYEGVA